MSLTQKDIQAARDQTEADWAARDVDERTCDCCDYPTDCKAYGGSNMINPMGMPSFDMFCEVCASTFISKAYTYPNQCVDSSLTRSIGYVANMLLDETRKAK